MKLLVCGGAGFIGSNFVRLRLREHGDEVVVLDKLTYAGREENFHDFADDPGFRFLHGAIEDPQAVANALDAGGADPIHAIVNFAAETHVDRSIAEPDAFVRTHALGTYVLLEAARERSCATCRCLPTRCMARSRTGRSPRTRRCGRPRPTRPPRPAPTCSCRAISTPMACRLTICRGSNNYGPYQYPEKLIPLMILNALHGDPLPVYGDGMQVRNWIHATDFGRAIGHVLEHGEPGEVYNAGGPDECANIEVVGRIIELTGAEESLIEHVTDRPGHDRRYSLSSEKVRALGWEPRVRFAEGLEQTVAWYRENEWWWKPIRSGDYRAYYERQYGRSLA